MTHNSLSKCACVDVDMGSYANQEVRALPFSTKRHPVVGTKMVGIDRCILPDVEYLWSQGIETIESCCGHGQTTGYILVKPEDCSKMRAFGYDVDAKNQPLLGLFTWPRLSLREEQSK
jgi:hypothetical protein